MLSDPQIKAAKPQDKAYKLTDEKGMYLLVNPNGGKYFRLNYRIDGKRKTLALGTYPDTSLKQAHGKRNEARKKIAEGIDPGEIKKAEKIAKSDKFEQITRLWLDSIEHAAKTITHFNKTRRFERHVFPIIGSMAITEIKPSHISSLVKTLVVKRELEVAYRVRAEISAAFDYAIAHDFTDYNPAQSVAAQLPPKNVKHRAALTEPKEVGQLLRDIEGYNGSFVVQCAFKLSPLLFQRPGEIRAMEWQDVDLIAKEWRYLVTKTDVKHIVPLSRQVIAILEELKPVTGQGRYVFPNRDNDNKPMSACTLKTALSSLGYESDIMTPHGFRSIASTLLNELGFNPDAIERQLCHMPKDQVRAAYNRAKYLDERRKMMQSWADYLDTLKIGAQVIPIRKNA